jgi:hypothetical protein
MLAAIYADWAESRMRRVSAPLSRGYGDCSMPGLPPRNSARRPAGQHMLEGLKTPASAKAAELFWNSGNLLKLLL